MGTLTPRTGLYLPAESGEVVNVKDLNDNFTKIDALLKGETVTSTTRPTAPVDGQIVHESDKDRWIGWDAANNRWIFVGGKIDWIELPLGNSWDPVTEGVDGNRVNHSIYIGIGPGHRAYIKSVLVRARAGTATIALTAGTLYTLVDIDKIPAGWLTQANSRIPYAIGYVAQNVATYTYCAFSWGGTDRPALNLRVGATLNVDNSISYIEVPEISWDVPNSLSL